MKLVGTSTEAQPDTSEKAEFGDPADENRLPLHKPAFQRDSRRAEARQRGTSGDAAPASPSPNREAA